MSQGVKTALVQRRGPKKAKNVIRGKTALVQNYQVNFLKLASVTEDHQYCQPCCHSPGSPTATSGGLNPELASIGIPHGPTSARTSRRPTKPNRLPWHTDLPTTVPTLPCAWEVMQPSWLCEVVLASLVAGPREPQPSATCPHHALTRTRWKVLVAVFGSCGWLVALRSEEGAANRIASRVPEEWRPKTLLVSDARHHSLPSECCTPNGCSQYLDAFRLPRLWTELIHVERWNSSFVPNLGLHPMELNARTEIGQSRFGQSRRSWGGLSWRGRSWGGPPPTSVFVIFIEDIIVVIMIMMTTMIITMIMIMIIIMFVIIINISPHVVSVPQ